MTLLERDVTAMVGALAAEGRRRVDLARLRGRVTRWSLAAAAVAAVGQTAGTVVAGRLAERPTAMLVTLLALFVVGAAVLDTAGRVAWSAVVDRAEGQLRADLLDSALHQPLGVLSEQAVGEVLDRVDDDTHELGTLLRRMGWDLVRTLLRAGPMWVVAGLTWWPAWLLFPLVGIGTVLVARPLTAEVARRKLLEEIAWTDHAAAMEEGVAARDDLRSSLGQSYLVRRCAELSAVVHARVASTCESTSRIMRRSGLLLHGLLAGTALAGTFLVTRGELSTAQLVTLFLVTTTFVGQLDQISRHLPDLQAGLGALTRLRTMLDAEPEPTGGRPVPGGPLALSIRGLHFSYPKGSSHSGTSTWSSRPAGLLPLSAGPVPASPHWRPWSHGPWIRHPARSSSAGSTCWSSTCSTCAAQWGWSPSAPRCSRRRWPTTSRCSPTSRGPRSRLPSGCSGSTDG